MLWLFSEWKYVPFEDIPRYEGMPIEFQAAMAKCVFAANDASGGLQFR
jgi:hypothetical protein